MDVYHELYKKWTPKGQHFSHVGMLMRSQLTVMDFNKGCCLKQATIKKGDKRYNVTFSKVTKEWSAKPIKEEKFVAMVKEAIESASKYEKFDNPFVPKLPEDIAKAPKPEKAPVTQNQDLI